MPKAVRDVTLSLTSQTQRVNVKLIDRSGELQVSVHTADPLLTADLRNSVHDLVGGLDRSGFHAETWQPGESPRHNSPAPPGTPQAPGHQPPAQSGSDPRQPGRNPYHPEYARPHRSSRANSEWMHQIHAFMYKENSSWRV